MTHYRSSIALAIAAGLFAAAAQAGITVQAKDCTGCTIAQIEALVPSCEQGERFITDFAAGRLYEGCYDIAGVSPRAVPINGNAPKPMAQGTKVYHWIQPTAAYQNTFQTYLDVYNINGHIRAAEAKAYLHVDLKPSISLGDDGYMNAYDAVRAPANNNAVLDWLTTTYFTKDNVNGAYPFAASPAMASALANLFNDLKVSILGIDFKVEVTVVFHDGSQRTYATNSFGDWAEVPGTAIDAHGNPIPEDYADIAGNGSRTYGFNGQPGYDQTNLHTLANLYGASIVYDPTGVVVVCTMTAGNKTVTCVWPK